MTKKSTSKGIIKDVAIVAIAIAVIFVSLQVAFGFGSNPFLCGCKWKYDSRTTGP